MILPEYALRTRMVGDSNVRALVADRVYPFHAPQNASRPYVTYRRVSSNPERHMGGAAPLGKARIQFDIAASTYDSARQVGDAMRMCLDGFRGEISVSGQSFFVRQLALENDLDNSVAPPAGNDDAIYGVMQDYAVDYTLPKPPFTKEPL